MCAPRGVHRTCRQADEIEVAATHDSLHDSLHVSWQVPVHAPRAAVLPVPGCVPYKSLPYKSLHTTTQWAWVISLVSLAHPHVRPSGGASYVQASDRNGIDRHSRMIERLLPVTLLPCYPVTRDAHPAQQGLPPPPRRTKRQRRLRQELVGLHQVTSTPTKGRPVARSAATPHGVGSVRLFTRRGMGGTHIDRVSIGAFNRGWGWGDN